MNGPRTPSVSPSRYTLTKRVSPAGEKRFALWNPPIVDEESGRRRSALSEASWLLSHLVDADVRTIGFSRTRRGAELLAEFARRAVVDPGKRERIQAYRAGYLAEAEEAVARKACRLAVLLRGTPARQIVAVAEAGESMPAKSTFFHPKLPSGLVIHPLVA